MGGVLSRVLGRFASLAARSKSVSLGTREPSEKVPIVMDESQIRAQLREWIVEHSKSKPTASELNDQTPLLETGLLSSLDIVEFVLFIEELRGEEVDTDDIEPEVFTTIDTLLEGFFPELA